MTHATHAAPVASKPTRVYNRKKKTLDNRDRGYAGHIHFGDAAIPSKVSLLAHVSPVKDQGQLGSCTANACAGALEYEENIAHSYDSALPLSRLFLYFNERAKEGSVDSDAGGEIRDVVKVASKFGAPLETTWPYSDDGQQFKLKPSTEAYAEGLGHRAVQYEAVPQNLDAFFHVLAVYNRPIVIGITVYESFEAESTMASGVIPMPNTETEQCMGGHAVLVVGYDKDKQAFLVRNSWGKDVYPEAIPGSGETGSFWLSFDFMMDPNLADDFWVLRAVFDDAVKGVV
ncbi:C1 family peptidase [Paraburkholderia sp. BCC1886]|uniref:C1 family peptidase n=1 Tax=Paraburkholderia sp. BCC1886 TaxID=2562670 RepID=UPI00118269FA|nr:C1 family peptidase [Paraburkholderia sp. BCC1886]